jgi:hypothetical protein
VSRYKSEISLKGPFFDNDPADTFLGNVSRMMHAGAEAGVKDVVGRMGTGRAEISAIGGHVADHVLGVVPEATTMVVIVGNRGFSAQQATSLMAAASEVEQSSGAFRKAAARMRAARAVNVDELTKGLQ